MPSRGYSIPRKGADAMRFLRFRRSREDDLDMEIRTHLDQSVRDRIERGESPAAARANALREFGNVGLIKEVTRETWGRHWLQQLLRDTQLGLRLIRKYPGFSLTAILTLALGIGANTAIFSIVYAVILRPLPFGDSERLVAMWTHTPQVERLPLTAANHRDIKAQNTVFEDVAIVRGTANFNLTGDGEPEWLLAAGIPANLFPLLRVTPVLGRGFVEGEDQPGQDHRVILSHALWNRRYARDPRIVGKGIRLDHVPYEVVGVMGPEFQYPTRDAQLWVPLTINPASFQTRTGYAHLAVARLKPGVTVEQAQSELDVIAARLASEYPDKNTNVGFRLAPLRTDIAEQARRPLWILLGAGLGMLLIGSCNIVNLLFGRALARSREIAVRTALGATSWRLVVQFVAELLPILILGLALGIFAAAQGLKVIVAWLPSTLPRTEQIEVNLPVLSFSAILLVITGFMVVLLPMLQSRKTDLVATLRDDTRTSAGGRARIRNLLVVAQIALTVVLLTGAGLLIRTLTALKDLDPGFRSEGVLTFRLAIPRSKYKEDDTVAALCERILDDVRSVPGVRAVAMVNRLPLGGPSGLSTIEFERPGQTPGEITAVDDTTTTPDYFKVMGIPLVAGRAFAEIDRAASPLVVILDEDVARRAWPGESAIGRRVRSGPTSPWAEVIGVVGHVRHENLESDKRWQIYWNYHQRARDRVSLVVRAMNDPHDLVAPVLAAIKSVDPDQPAFAIRTMTEVVDGSLSLRWFNTIVVAVFAGSSLLLAIIGIYGVIAWTVRQRTREIGVRMALGAHAREVLALVLGQGMKLALLGIGVGVVGALMLTRLLRGLLFEVGPADPLTFTLVPVLLLGAALLACLIPAHRATRLDPMIALRQD
jgi:putative ABC transport system permease protein